MNRKEIDDMMRHLPSQRAYYSEFGDAFREMFAGLAFVLCVVILVFM